MSQLMRLRLDEPVRLEHAQISALYESLGDTQAEEVICRAMEELAMRLALMERAYAAEDYLAVGKSARGLVKIAGQIGMAKLGRVAADVADCAAAGNKTALGATLARLVRISDRSLTAVWETGNLFG